MERPKVTITKQPKTTHNQSSIKINFDDTYSTPTPILQNNTSPNIIIPTLKVHKKLPVPDSTRAVIPKNQMIYLPIVSKIDPSKSIDTNLRINEFYGINFENGARRITIVIKPSSKKINGGMPINISFLPGSKCEFGDNHACVFSFRNGPNSDVLFLTIHSGVTGEAQQFRHSIEGTRLNQAGFSIDKVKRNLEIFQNSDVKIKQGKLEVEGLHISNISRIPARKVHEYFQVPLEDALSFSFKQNPNTNPSLYMDKPLIVIETCGWKMPGEPWAKDITPTTGSIYLAIITETE